jgi:hypothetical protein
MLHAMQAKREIPQDRIEVMRAVVRRGWSWNRDERRGLLGLSTAARGQENRKQESESHRVPQEQIESRVAGSGAL